MISSRVSSFQSGVGTVDPLWSAMVDHQRALDLTEVGRDDQLLVNVRVELLPVWLPAHEAQTVRPFQSTGPFPSV